MVRRCNLVDVRIIDCFIVCCLSLSMTAFGCRAKGGPETGKAQVGSAAASIPTDGKSVAPASPACTGPVFQFGHETRLRWARTGKVVFRGQEPGLALGMEVGFDREGQKQIVTNAVGLVCKSCDAAARSKFLDKAKSLEGKSVAVDGILEGVWTEPRPPFAVTLDTQDIVLAGLTSKK
jgi:hypothetical protein